MSKNLKTINTLFKIGKILSMIVMIVSIVGAVFCVMGATICFALAKVSPSDVENFKTVLEMEDLSFSHSGISCVMATISCIASAVVAGFAVNYFKNAMIEKTPFTLPGAKRMLRLGIISIAVPLGASFINSTMYSIYLLFSAPVTPIEVEGSADAIMGILFIVMSVIFKYGAELEEKARYNGNEEQI